jgi:hypothetical protein
MGPFLTDDGLPFDAPLLTGHGHHGVLMPMGDRHAVVDARGLIEHGLLSFTHGNRGHNYHAIP